MGYLGIVWGTEAATAYCLGCSAVTMSTVAIGHPSGRVTLLAVSPGRGLAFSSSSLSIYIQFQ